MVITIFHSFSWNESEYKSLISLQLIRTYGVNHFVATRLVIKERLSFFLIFIIQCALFSCINILIGIAVSS